MKKLFDQVSLRCSRITTNAYSTSFSLGIKMLDKKFHSPIYSIYGFVRFADEIVDTFHDYDKKKLLTSFTKDTYQAIEERISLNPILQSFQLVVNKYNIDHQLIDAFFHSMELDLEQASYDKKGYDEYIYGSADSSVASIMDADLCDIASRQSMIQLICCSIVMIIFDNTEGLPGPETVKRLGNPSMQSPK